MKKLIYLLFFIIQRQLVFAQSIEEMIFKDKIASNQRDYGAKKNTLPCSLEKSLYISNYKKVAKSLKEGVGDSLIISESKIPCPKTEFETIAQRIQCESIQKKANKVLNMFSIDTSSVYFSFVPCLCFNAQSSPLGDYNVKYSGKWLIEYNIGFSIYSQKIGVATSMFTPFSGNVDSLDLNPKNYFSILKDSINYNIYLGIGAFLLANIAGNPNIESDSISIEKTRNPIVAAAISAGISTFTLYHELSHIILNHHAIIKKLPNSKAKITQYKMNAEMQADSLALNIMNIMMKNEDKSIILDEDNAIESPYRYAPLIYFSWLDALQKFEFKNADAYRGMKSHPSANDRRNNLLKQYVRHNLFNSNTDLNYADLVEGSVSYIYDIIALLFNRDSVQKLVKKSVKTCSIK